MGWYDYGVRFYDPTLGRWHVLDPLAEEDYYNSLYTYVLNNPMILIGPTGMKWVNRYQEYLDSNRDNVDEQDIAKYEAKAKGVNDLLTAFKENDSELHDYIDNLSVTSTDESSVDVSVVVRVSAQKEGDNGQTKHGKADNSDTYNGGVITTPTTMSPQDGSSIVGFTMTIYGASGNNKNVYADHTLTNESGDVMYFMEHNDVAKNEKSNHKMTPSEYQNSNSNNYSNKVERVYRKRKRTKKNGKKHKYPY